jgi:predicted GIY-YIG superfamily endonuclease
MNDSEDSYNKRFTNANYRPFKALVVGSSPTQPKDFSDGMGLHSSGSSGRHYIGSTINLERRLFEHRNRGTHTIQRLGDRLETIAVLELETIEQARIPERQLKRKNNPKLAIAMLQGLRRQSDPA